MRLLLDENVPKKLKKDLLAHDVYAVRELKRDGYEDEDVLQFLIDFNFDALITCDKNLRFQQNLTRYPTPIIVLDTYTNAYPILKLIVPRLLEQLKLPLPAGATVVYDLSYQAGYGKSKTPIWAFFRFFAAYTHSSIQ